MKTLPRVLASATAATFAGLAMGQAVNIPPHSGGYGVDSPFNRLYNRHSMITFDGTVTGIEVSPPMNGMAPAKTLLVKADNGGTTIVDLGPSWFVDHQFTKIKLKDKIRVTGSKVMLGGKGLILAEQVVKDKRVLALRDPNGLPYWAAARVAAANGARTDEAPAVLNLNGVIVRADTIANGQWGGPDRSVVLRTADGNLVTVDLGPEWYYDRQDFTLPTVGSSLGFSYAPDTRVFGGTVIAPYSVFYGPAVLRLRDATGRPVWNAWGGGG